jgi:hypothetical protein
MNKQDRWKEFMDAARRGSDIVNGILAGNAFDDIAHKWIALRLDNGDYDGVLYDTRRDCVRHQKNEFHCMYMTFRNIRNGLRPDMIARVMLYHREAYDAGFRLPDPDDKHGGRELAMTTAANDHYLRKITRATMQDLRELVRADRIRHGY